MENKDPLIDSIDQESANDVSRQLTNMLIEAGIDMTSLSEGEKQVFQEEVSNVVRGLESIFDAKAILKKKIEEDQEAELLLDKKEMLERLKEKKEEQEHMLKESLAAASEMIAHREAAAMQSIENQVFEEPTTTDKSFNEFLNKFQDYGKTSALNADNYNKSKNELLEEIKFVSQAETKYVEKSTDGERVYDSRHFSAPERVAAIKAAADKIEALQSIDSSKLTEAQKKDMEAAEELLRQHREKKLTAEDVLVAIIADSSKSKELADLLRITVKQLDTIQVTPEGNITTPGNTIVVGHDKLQGMFKEMVQEQDINNKVSIVDLQSEQMIRNKMEQARADKELVDNYNAVENDIKGEKNNLREAVANELGVAAKDVTFDQAASHIKRHQESPLNNKLENLETVEQDHGKLIDFIKAFRNNNPNIRRIELLDEIIAGLELKKVDTKIESEQDKQERWKRQILEEKNAPQASHTH